MKEQKMSVNRKEKRTAAIWSVLFAVGILIFALSDQFTKYLAAVHLKNTEGITLIPGVLKLQYLENRGMAFGMLQGKQLILILICLVFFAAAAFVFARTPKTAYYLPLTAVIAVLAGGAAGNFIDRIFRGYVVDFIYFSLIDFPVFNLADIYVVCGGIALAVIVIFKYKDGDFRFLF